MASERNYWVWSTHPTEDRIEALTSTSWAWWTCHEDTSKGDLILVYLTTPTRAIPYLVEASTDAVPIDDNPEEEWYGGWACDFTPQAQFANPLTLSDMKADRMLANEFSALKGNFQQRVYRVSADVWIHLIDRLTAENPSTRKKLHSFRAIASHRGY